MCPCIGNINCNFKYQVSILKTSLVLDVFLGVVLFTAVVADFVSVAFDFINNIFGTEVVFFFFSMTA